MIEFQSEADTATTASGFASEIPGMQRQTGEATISKPEPEKDAEPTAPIDWNATIPANSSVGLTAPIR